MDRIGIREPVGSLSDAVHVFTDDGMHYERLRGDIGVIVAADHEDVGLVTYYRASADEWNDLVDDAVEHVGVDLYLRPTNEY